MNTSDAAGPYSSWTEPSTGFTVDYSLPVFHEIDFVVNEGFRRIPHGGIENGGLLLGDSGADGVRIDAFLPIECSHAFGPAFLLSDEDIEKLRNQINNAGLGQQVVGWFISHSRSQLMVTEQETYLAATLFPARCITVLVKPEKFKTSQFAFFIGTNERDGSGRSFPLPIISPKNRPAAAPTLKPIGQMKIIPEAPPPAPTPPVPTLDAPTLDAPSVQQVQPEPLAPPEKPADVAPLHPPPVPRPESAPPFPPIVVEDRPRPNGALWLMAGAAMAFAGLAAYGFYVSAVPMQIPLSIMAHGNSLVVSWPAEMSRAATEARIRVNNSEIRELAPDEKASGTVSVDNGSDSVEIELILGRWGRESHSIERYLRTAKTSVRSVSPPQASAPAVQGP